MTGRRWRSLWLVAALSGGAAAGEVNPVHPGALVGLEERATCLGYARQVGELLLARPPSGKLDIYSGDTGVALFFVGLFGATKEKVWLEAARKRIDGVRAGVDDAGLYTGMAGAGQVCLDAWHASRDRAFLDRAVGWAKRIEAMGRPRGLDIISGAAGTGIFLLNLHAATGDRRHLKQARAAGDAILEAADRTGGMARWHTGRHVWIGFSHGSAGMGYFLLHLFRATKYKPYLDGAEAAARHVLSTAVDDGKGGYEWTKTEPPRPKDGMVFQWCHGAPGIGLFFIDLERFRGAKRYGAALDRCIASTRRAGRTARVGGCQCHGVSGNAELFVEAYRLRRDPGLMKSARLFGSALLERRDGRFAVAAGLDDYRYPAGYMLGLAGIGQYFLRLADPDGTEMPLMVR